MNSPVSLMAWGLAVIGGRVRRVKIGERSVDQLKCARRTIVQGIAYDLVGIVDGKPFERGCESASTVIGPPGEKKKGCRHVVGAFETPTAAPLSFTAVIGVSPGPHPVNLPTSIVEEKSRVAR